MRRASTSCGSIIIRAASCGLTELKAEATSPRSWPMVSQPTNTSNAVNTAAELTRRQNRRAGVVKGFARGTEELDMKQVYRQMGAFEMNSADDVSLRQSCAF